MQNYKPILKKKKKKPYLIKKKNCIFLQCLIGPTWRNIYQINEFYNFISQLHQALEDLECHMCPRHKP